MNLLESLLLGLLQGLTEFLPISSSGHLVLAEHVLKIQMDSASLQAFDVILHAGTLGALIVYFWKDWIKMFKEGKECIQMGNIKDSLLFKIIIATIPAVIVGFLAKDYIEQTFRSPFSVAICMIIVGFVLLLCEIFPKTKHLEEPTLLQSIITGCAQAIALIPGVSRSGTTIAAGMFQGLKRADAAKFAFLLGTPAIAGATLLVAIDIYKGIYQLPATMILITGFIAALASSLLCVHFLLKFLKKYRLWVFTLYLWIIAALIIWKTNHFSGHIEMIIIGYVIPFFRSFGYPIVFLSACIEALPFVGVLIPGGTIIIVAGAFALDAGLSLTTLIIMSSIGAVLGDYIGYFIGKRYGEKILVNYGPMFGFKEEHLFVTHRFCIQYGGLALVLGRFNNIIRPIVPLVVGSAGLTAWRFWLFNIIGGVTWSIFSVYLGYFARESWQVIQGKVGLIGGSLFGIMIIVAFFAIRYEAKKLKAQRKQSTRHRYLKKFKKQLTKLKKKIEKNHS